MCVKEKVSQYMVIEHYWIIRKAVKDGRADTALKPDGAALNGIIKVLAKVGDARRGSFQFFDGHLVQSLLLNTIL